MRLVMLCFSLFLALGLAAEAREIEGVKIPETINLAGGQQLILNGVGIRSKFFFDIYIAELYLSEKLPSTEAVLALDKPRRVVMRFIYSEVGAEKRLIRL